jgi:hypothetical protein
LRKKKSTTSSEWFKLLPLLFLLFIIPLSFNLGNISTFMGISASEVATTDTTYRMNVLVIKYFPVTANGNLNKEYTGDIEEPYTVVRERTIDYTDRLRSAVEDSSKYLGYKDWNSTPSLIYQIVDTKEYKEPVPFEPTSRVPHYDYILNRENICDYVQNKGVNEVWIWAYQGPSVAEPGSPLYLGISESKMSGPFGDISNSHMQNDMPNCGKTYRVYTYNYGEDFEQALESWGHQLEFELRHIDYDLFSTWQGTPHPATSNEVGRCGSVHNPPNARFEYDWMNYQNNATDCLDWSPEKLGQSTEISCGMWGCTPWRYMVWNWQNLPGKNNTKTYNSVPLRNWWDVHGDFDGVMANHRSLIIKNTDLLNCFMGGNCNIIPVSTSKPTPYPPKVEPANPSSSRSMDCLHAGGICADSSGKTSHGKQCSTYMGAALSKSSCDTYFYCWKDCSFPQVAPQESSACSQAGGTCADSSGVSQDGSKRCATYLGDSLSKNSCENYYYCWKDCN